MSSPYVWINSDTCSSWGRSFNSTSFGIPNFILFLFHFIKSCSDEDPSLGESMRGMLGVIAYSGGGTAYSNWIAEMASLDEEEYPGLSDVASVNFPSPFFT